MIAPACYRRNDVALIARRLMSTGRAPLSELEALLPLYREAARLRDEKEAAGIYGLCIVTDDAARKVSSR